MKFKVNTKELKPVLDVLQKVSKDKPIIPILGTFKLEHYGGILYITASDLETTITGKVKIEEPIEDGAVCVLSNKFTAVVKNFKDETLLLSVDEKDNLIIKSKGGRFKAPTMSVDEYPIVNAGEAKMVDFPRFELIDGLNKTTHCVSADDLRPTFCGVSFKLNNESTKIAATNAIKLAVVTSGALTAEETEFILPAKAASLIKLISSDEDIYVQIGETDKNINITTRSYDMNCRAIEGTYVNYDSIIPKEGDCNITVNTEAVIDSIKRVKIFANETTSSVIVIAKDNNIEIKTEDVDFSLEAVENIECSVSGEGLFKTNAQLLLDLLLRVGVEFTTIYFTGSNQHRPIVIKPTTDTDNVLMLLTQQLI